MQLNVPELIGPTSRKLETRRKAHVYVMYDGQTKLCKIGRTQTNGRRQRELMSSHGGILVNVMNEEVSDCFAAEAQFHKHFREHRKNGEWVEAELATVILYVGEQLGASTVDFENPARLALYISASEPGGCRTGSWCIAAPR